MRALVLGAGIIGLACAEELIRRGHEVTVVDPAPGSGASHVGAGMLSPSSEVWHGEEVLLGLGLRSLALWPELASRIGVRLHETGTLLVGADHGDLQHVERHVALLNAHGREVTLRSGRELRDLEPGLSARVAGGALLADDHSIDPRAVVAALLQRIPVLPARPEATYDVTVLATGTRLPAPFSHLVHAVRGEIVRVHAQDPPARTVRGWVHGEPTYVVPRVGGEVVIGATSEEHDEPPVATMGGVARLLESSRTLLPGLDRARFAAAEAADRPATADHLPLVGPSGVPGTVLAAGLFRHGILLAPITARLLADHLEDGRVEPAFDPRRFPLPERTPA